MTSSQNQESHVFRRGSVKGRALDDRLDIFFKNGEGAVLTFQGTKEEWDDIMKELKGAEQ